MRTITLTKTLYTYDELSDEAAARAARDLNQFLWDCGSAGEDMRHIFVHEAEAAGITDARDLTYSLYSQGGYPTFSGTLTYTEPSGHFRTTTVDFTYTSHSGYILNCEDMGGMEDDEWQALEDEVLARIEDLSHSLFWQFRTQDEVLGSDDYAREAFAANGTEFYEDGSVA